ncbi:hypothetical protein FRC09_005779 [Ceratobasidium sp. 395]|nr:hypothetical protein FRC09_005779 [Ceratobasidium sp. 395]
MASSSDENQNLPRTSSPTPIRDTQPQCDSPTTTARGTQRGHAKFDTPPEGTQPIELERSGRSRKLSSRAQEIIASGKPLAGHSNAAEPEPPQPASASKPHPDKPQQGKRKRPSLKFDGEETTKEEPARVVLRPPRKRGAKAPAHSPPPKPPGHCRATTTGRASQPIDRTFRVKGNAASSLSEFLGCDPATTTTCAINNKILSLSDHRASQMDAQGRYTKVRGEAPTPLSPLGKKRGGYHRDTLLALGHPKPSNTKRPPSDVESGPPKRARFDEQSNVSTVWNPAFRNDVLSLPSFTQREPASKSSTQQATVHAPGSQRQPIRASQPTDRWRFGAGLTPIPEPRRDFFSQPTARHDPPPPSRFPLPATRTRSPDLHTRPSNPRPPPSPAQPCVLVPGTPSRSLSPNPRTRPSGPWPQVAAPAQPRVLVRGTPSRSPTPPERSAKPQSKPHAKPSRSDTRKPPPHKKPDTATKSESEPEPITSPKPKRYARQVEVGHAKRQSSHASAGPSTHHPQHTPPRQRRASPALPTRHHDVQAILNWLGDVLNGGDSGDEGDEPAVDELIELLLQRRQRTRPSTSSRHQPRNQPSSSRHAHSRASSSLHKSGPSASRRARRHTASDDDNDELSQSSSAKARKLEGYPSALEGDSNLPVDCTRNGLGRYRGKRGRVASHAIPYLLAVAIRKGAYQQQDTYIIWAQKEYIRAWNKLYPKIKYHPPSRHLLSLNLNADEDYYEHPHLFDVISESLFGRPDSPVILQHKKFTLLPYPAVALVLTIMQDCLQEWDTGCLRIRDNHFKHQQAVFDAHLHGLKVYKGKAHGRLDDLRSEWFLAGMQHAGIRVVEGSEDQDLSQDFCQPVTRACFIRSDDDSEHASEPEPEPEPVPEPEPEYNQYGYQTARSKGKGKAADETDHHLNDPEDDFESGQEY